ncbi:hypothetical protein G6M89_04830 [Natronolimnobius sp. AArcel1]|nr:hypothetical protein [Natronolimnobius sp. AArcel1]
MTGKSDVKGVAEDVIDQLPLPRIEGAPFDPGEIWTVVIRVAVNQTSLGNMQGERRHAL